RDRSAQNTSAKIASPSAVGARRVKTGNFSPSAPDSGRYHTSYHGTVLTSGFTSCTARVTDSIMLPCAVSPAPCTNNVNTLSVIAHPWEEFGPIAPVTVLHALVSPRSGDRPREPLLGDTAGTVFASLDRHISWLTGQRRGRLRGQFLK